MQDSVRSEFTISSPKLGVEEIASMFPWRITEATAPNEKLKFPDYITAFDLGLGEHERVDHHLVAVKHELLAHEKQLHLIGEECGYALWIYYKFCGSEGAFNIHPSLHAAFALLQVEVVFHIRPIT
jgi:hypothetical protein